MTSALTTSFGYSVAGYSACATDAGVWAAGGAAFDGKRKPVRYAAVRLGAIADVQSVGIHCKFMRGVQHFTQPDGLRAVRSSLRLVLR